MNSLFTLGFGVVSALLAACNDGLVAAEGRVMQRDSSGANFQQNVVLPAQGPCPIVLFGITTETDFVYPATETNLVVGVDVRVWHDGIVQESCPTQSLAYRIEQLPTQ